MKIPNDDLISQKRAVKLRIMQLVIALGLGFILFNLLKLQILEHQRYESAATSNYLYHLPLEPARGMIFDRNGIILADNEPIFDLRLINKKSYKAQQIQALGALLEFTGSDYQRIDKELKTARNFETIVLKRRLNEQELAKFYLNKQLFPGIFVQASLERRYPQGAVAEPFLGKIGRIDAKELAKYRKTRNYNFNSWLGKIGIELQYEPMLRGKMGFQDIEVGANGELQRFLERKAATNGDDIYLTIDLNLQKVASRALNHEQGAVVALDPNNGEVLALVSHTFPVTKAKHISETAKAAPSINFNHAIQARFPPASTVKLFYALYALDHELISPSFTIKDEGLFKLPNSEHIYYDWTRGRGHGMVNVQKAIVESSDPFFYQLAVKMGIDKLGEALKTFGFGAPSGIDLKYENPGLVASPAWKSRALGQRWYLGDTVISGIGQGFMLATPIQQALAVATIAGRGQSWVPHLLLGKVHNSKLLLTKLEPRPAVKLQNPKNWEIVIKAMQQVIVGENGTAHKRFLGDQQNPLPPITYTVAGKTGEAQLFRNREQNQMLYKNIPKHLRNHNWFVVFAPVDKPRIAIAIISEHSNVAVKVARQMLDYYLNAARPSKYEALKHNVSNYLHNEIFFSHNDPK